MFELIIKLYKFFWGIRKTGFYEIISPFVYPPTGKSFSFRTVVYLDADFQNFIPNAQSIAQSDENFVVYYQACYQQHIKKIYDFLDGVNQSSSFWGNLLVIPFLVLLNSNVFIDLYTWIWQGITPDFVHDFYLLWDKGILSKDLIKLFFNILTLTGAFSIRKFLLQTTVRLLMRLGFWYVRVYKKKKGKSVDRKIG